MAEIRLREEGLGELRRELAEAREGREEEAERNRELRRRVKEAERGREKKEKQQGESRGEGEGERGVAGQEHAQEMRSLQTTVAPPFLHHSFITPPLSPSLLL